MKFMNKNKKGFTLVELMIVVVIMAILVAVAVPIYNNVTKSSKVKACDANAKTLGSQINAIIMDTIGGTDDTNTVKPQALSKDTTLSALVGTGTGTIMDWLQGEEFPVCPFSTASTTYSYYVKDDGEVVCGTAITEAGVVTLSNHAG